MDLTELLEEEGEEFIQAAYRALLKRRADPAGARGYLRALEAGTPKLAILYELYHSTESREQGVELPGLMDALAREGIGEPADAADAAASIRSAAQLLAVEDSDRFAALAYRVLLKRPADLAGLANCQARLKDGISRIQILHELFSSEERRRRGTQLPGLREMFQEEGLATASEEELEAAKAVPPAVGLEQLLGLHGAAFVSCAFSTLHQRNPDEEESAHYTGRLRAGEPKLQLLNELSALPSGSGAVQRLPGLSSALFWHRLGQVPFIGALFRRRGGAEGHALTDLRARATEERLFELETAYAEKASQLEDIGSRALALAQHSMDQCRDLNERVASLERSLVVMRKLLIQQAADGAATQAATGAESAAPVPAERLLTDARAEEIFRDLRQAGR